MKLSTLSLLSTIASTALATATVPFRIDFNVRRGSSKDQLSPEDDSTPKFVKRDGSFEMILSNQQTFYMADLKIGSNQDENRVLVDTGSSDLWVMSHDLNCVPTPNQRRSMQSFEEGTGVRYCQRRNDAVVPNPTKTIREVKREGEEKAGASVYSTVFITEGAFGTNSPFVGSAGGSGSGSNTCTSYGSFNTENSDTFTENNTYPFVIQYADDTHAIGIWGYDNVIINNVTVNNLSFAVANETSSDVGVLGIGLPGLEVTSQYGYMYENLPIKLRNQDTADARTGSILFGAIDHAKYQGDLVTVNMMRTYRAISYPVRIQVPMTNIDFVQRGSTTNILSASASSPTGVVLDTGSTLSYVFPSTLQALGNAVGGRYSNTVGAYIVDCNLANSDATVNIEFGGNKTIEVPLSDLVLQASRTQCILGVLAQSADSSYMLFGDNILRSAYIVYDIDDYQVSLAQVAYTNDTSIEIVSANGISNTTGLGTASSSSSSSGSSSSSSSTTSSRSSSTSTGQRNAAAGLVSTPIQIMISLCVFYSIFI
ncbi:SAP9 Candidapepsin-9 [Candida maltosa Xu316]